MTKAAAGGVVLEQAHLLFPQEPLLHAHDNGLLSVVEFFAAAAANVICLPFFFHDRWASFLRTSGTRLISLVATFRLSTPYSVASWYLPILGTSIILQNMRGLSVLAQSCRGMAIVTISSFQRFPIRRTLWVLLLHATTRLCAICAHFFMDTSL